MKLLIQNARIATEESPNLAHGDVLIEGGVIRKIGKGIKAPDDCRVIDAKERILMPGMFDAHVHFREPGFEAKENIATGSEAAINGGITGVVIAAITRAADSLGQSGRGLDATTVDAPDANIRQLARSIFSDNVFAFELTSVLLLVAVVGTVLLARRQKGSA